MGYVQQFVNKIIFGTIHFATLSHASCCVRQSCAVNVGLYRRLPFTASTIPSHSSVFVRGASTETSQKRQHRGVSAAILTVPYQIILTSPGLKFKYIQPCLVNNSLRKVFFFDTVSRTRQPNYGGPIEFFLDTSFRPFMEHCKTTEQLAERGLDYIGLGRIIPGCR